MAVYHCPKCDIPMTDAESALGRCPICKASVEPPTTRMRRPASTPPRSVARIENSVARKDLSFFPLFGILFVGGLLFALVLAN